MKHRCNICSIEFDDVQEFGKHNKIKHSLLAKETYDRYIMKESKVCSICGINQKKFVDISVGYRDTCSNKECVKEIVKIKKLKTNLEKYGVAHPLQNKDVSNKRGKTISEKYLKGEIGESISKGLLSRTQEQKQNASESRTNTIISRYESLEKYAEAQRQIKLEAPMCEKMLSILVKSTVNNEYTPMNYSKLLEKKNLTDEIITKKCNMCGSVLSYLESCQCRSKNKKEYIENIHNKLKNMYPTTIEMNYVLNETDVLDIFIPDKNIAFMYIENKTRLYIRNYIKHQKEKYKKIGIDVYFIFEYETMRSMHSNDILFSIICNKLNINTNRIYARKCVKKEISSDDYRLFLEHNHIQGAMYSKDRFGLYYNDELVAVVGLGYNRFKKDEYELHRFSVKLGTSVIGGFSKLMNGITNVYSYCDIAKFNGEGYIKTGFRKLYSSPSNFTFIKNNKVYSRYCASKKLQHKIIDNVDMNKSTIQNMLDNGFNVLYDGGSIKMHRA